MQFSLSAVKNIKFPVKGLRISREDVLVWGILFSCLLLGVFLLWDGFLFYNTVMVGRESVASGRKAPALDAEEIDKVLGVLEEREKKFNEILNRP